MRIAFDGKKPEHFCRPFRKMIEQTHQVFKLQRIALCGRCLLLIRGFELYKPDITFFFLVEISHRMVDQPSDPPFKGTFTPEGADFLKYFQEIRH